MHGESAGARVLALICCRGVDMYNANFAND
jgi:hypothetical protein